jgi:hypothetical protein
VIAAAVDRYIAAKSNADNYGLSAPQQGVLEMKLNLIKAALTMSVFALAAPAGANAASSSSTATIAGLPGAELSLSVATPAAMTFTHSAAGTSTSAVSVVSTSPNWTLSVSDQDASGSGTPGRMDKVNCVSGALLGGALTNPLQWSADATTFANLSSSPATVATGSLVGGATVTYRQSLAASEAVALGDCFRLTATYTVNDV